MMQLSIILVLFTVCGAAVQAQSVGRIESKSIVFAYPQNDPYDRANRFGFNHAPSVTRLPDGRLMAVWFSGPYEGSVHQVIAGSYSDDGGRTWSPAEVVRDEPRRSDFDPGFLMTDDASFLFHSAGRWTRYPFVGFRDTERKEVGVESFRITLRRWRDNGTWSDAELLGSPTGWNCRSNGIELASGRLLIPVHRLGSPLRSAVMLSDDGGGTWRMGGEPKIEARGGGGEPTVAELPDGTLLMAIRVRAGTVWFARSDDGGETWSDAKASDVPGAGASHNLFVDSRNRLLLTHNPTVPHR